MRWIVGLAMAMQLSAAPEEASVRKVLDAQSAAWNRGDIAGFMTGYEHSEDITFIGKTLTRGYDGVLARYRRDYGDRAKMGKLQFVDVEVKMLAEGVALVWGRYVLERTAEGGGPATGRFTLIAKKAAAGWKFIHDHTSN
ncbi:YybH family protein [Bryobacter aggregatus]|uniref:YybH family protein n=1 Tax=Bryobacter aggregatus TaxID=360054 RepID=UPI0004E0ECDF|nr:SgcJ/EcaC family oxidoreductase [Bryobacter aggregatus]